LSFVRMKIHREIIGILISTHTILLKAKMNIRIFNQGGTSFCSF